MRNKERQKAYDKAYRKANVERRRANSLAWRKRHAGTKKYKDTYLNRNLGKHGLTLETYREMVTKQNGCCKICGIHESNLHTISTARNTARLVVDHCHITGKIRGALCVKCNSGIGLLNDSVELLIKASLYLKESL